jgi:hypothetical protein
VSVNNARKKSDRVDFSLGIFFFSLLEECFWYNCRLYRRYTCLKEKKEFPKKIDTKDTQYHTNQRLKIEKLWKFKYIIVFCLLRGLHYDNDEFTLSSLYIIHKSFG